MVLDAERSRFWSYVVIGLVAFIAGMALGQIASSRGPGGSRIEWPAPPPPHPRSLSP